MSLSIPYVFIGGPGNKAYATQVNANFQAVAAKFTEGAGGIGDGDISTTAGIKASKLSAVAGTRVTASQLEDDAVDLRVLKDDATAGSPNAAVNTANHIKDAIITNAKLVVNTIAKDRLKYVEVSQAFSIPTENTALAWKTWLVQYVPAPPLPAMSAMLPIRCTIDNLAIDGGGFNAVTGMAASVQDVAGVTKYVLVTMFRTDAVRNVSGTITFTYLSLT